MTSQRWMFLHRSEAAHHAEVRLEENRLKDALEALDAAFEALRWEA